MLIQMHLSELGAIVGYVGGLYRLSEHVYARNLALFTVFSDSESNSLESNSA